MDEAIRLTIFRPLLQAHVWIYYDCANVSGSVVLSSSAGSTRPAQYVPEELVTQAQGVLQGRSRSLIIRELQVRTRTQFSPWMYRSLYRQPCTSNFIQKVSKRNDIQFDGRNVQTVT